MQTTQQIIDEIILKSPYGRKLWKQRQERICTVGINASNNKYTLKEDMLSEVYPTQTYLNFEEDNNNEK